MKGKILVKDIKFNRHLLLRVSLSKPPKGGIASQKGGRKGGIILKT